MITLICEKCKKDFNAYPYEKKKGRKYCSNKCRKEANIPKARNIFSEWNDTSAYVLGLLWADGNLYKQEKKSMMLDLSLIDKSLITKINDLFKHNCKVYTYKPKKGNTVYSTKTRDAQVVKFLIDEGMSERKTYELQWPNTLPRELLSSFIRGFFDGDGCVFKNKVNGYEYLHCSFTGVRTLFLFDLFDELELLGFHPKWYRDKRSNTYQIKIYSKEAVKNFASYIYEGESICLKRKKKIFIEKGYLI